MDANGDGMRRHVSYQWQSKPASRRMFTLREDMLLFGSRVRRCELEPVSLQAVCRVHATAERLKSEFPLK
jgi:hypothetical protein